MTQKSKFEPNRDSVKPITNQTLNQYLALLHNTLSSTPQATHTHRTLRHHTQCLVNKSINQFLVSIEM